MTIAELRIALAEYPADAKIGCELDQPDTILFNLLPYQGPRLNVIADGGGLWPGATDPIRLVVVECENGGE